ncbi:MAG TPA: cellulose synthase operon protein YhjQ/BcsQ, partial [Clostridia bacterium]|nr:cellulose synthase operon protein YhjQ/BcsQ [Clostridia bacterium]
ERQKDSLEASYRHITSILDQRKIDEAFGSGRLPNITTIQEPTSPVPAQTKRKKIILMTFFGSLAGAFALAFFIEKYLDQSIRRPIEVESGIGLPLFLSIPFLKQMRFRKALGGTNSKLLPQGGAEDVPEARKALPTSVHPLELDEHTGRKAYLGTLPVEMAPWNPSHVLRPFSETLRDRLITFFEMKNLTHKPKLVAVTGCAEGVGVSSVAAGLAASLSETGEGNVLLVDMNQQNGAAHHFHRGNLGVALDDALIADKRENALVQENLYVVTEVNWNEQLPRVLPNRFKNLVPKLKASDYDYIIFDMPPVSQISITPRLARYMDAVLMVVESERTGREVLKRATSLLAESKTNVGIVLNKTRTYVPKRLQQEL